jgi:hypothetical protein
VASIEEKVREKCNICYFFLNKILKITTNQSFADQPHLVNCHVSTFSNRRFEKIVI